MEFKTQIQKCLEKRNVNQNSLENESCGLDVKMELKKRLQREIINNNMKNIIIFIENIISCEQNESYIFGILQLNGEKCLLRLGTKKLDEETDLVNLKDINFKSCIQ